MNCLILGAAGFIGSHLCKKLKSEGHYVVGVDIKDNEYFKPKEFCSYFVKGDLRDPAFVNDIMTPYAIPLGRYWHEVYQLAADMGGAGYIFTGEHDADVMHNSALINLNVAKAAVENKVAKLFYSSSACIYPAYNQEDPENPNCEESSAYPAAPDSEYGWEKLFSERLYKAFERNYGLQVRIARFHNIFGPHGTWQGDKAKAPAAICRKVAEAIEKRALGYTSEEELSHRTIIDIWGDGSQTRSFLYIDECIEGIIRLMRSDCTEIINIGSDEMISINDLARMIIRISGKHLSINNIPGPTGVRGRNSHNELIHRELKWKPNTKLEDGIRETYKWVYYQTNNIEYTRMQLPSGEFVEMRENKINAV